MEDLNIKLLSALKSLMPFIDADIDRGIRNDNRHGGLEYRARNAKAVILEAEHTIAAAEQAQQAECKSCDGFNSGCEDCSGLGKDGHLAALRQLANVAHRVAHAMGLPAGFDVTTLPDVVTQRLAAQQQAEPVAWRWRFGSESMDTRWHYSDIPLATYQDRAIEPLYTQPPAVAVPDRIVEAVMLNITEAWRLGQAMYQYASKSSGKAMTKAAETEEEFGRVKERVRAMLAAAQKGGEA